MDTDEEQTYEYQLHGATEARGGCFVFFRPAVICLTGQWEVGFGSVGSDSWGSDGGRSGSRSGSNWSGGHDFSFLFNFLVVSIDFSAIKDLKLLKD